MPISKSFENGKNTLRFYQKTEKNMEFRPDFDFDILW